MSYFDLSRLRINHNMIHYRYHLIIIKVYNDWHLTFSPGIFLGLTLFMIQTASITIRTPAGGLFMVFTSTTSDLLRDLRLAVAASFVQQSTGKRKVTTNYTQQLYVVSAYSTNLIPWHSLWFDTVHDAHCLYNHFHTIGGPLHGPYFNHIISI